MGVDYVEFLVYAELAKLDQHYIVYTRMDSYSASF